jgi:hypothetical protein
MARAVVSAIVTALEYDGVAETIHESGVRRSQNRIDLYRKRVFG